MGYERLKVVDHVDKWDAAKLRHVEDGIIANEKEIQNKQPKGDYATNEYVLTLLEKIEANRTKALTKEEVLELCK